MKRLAIRLPLLLALWLLPTASLLAQEGPKSVSLPNRMTVHTWFIVGAAGAFLLWSISFAVQRQRESMEGRMDKADLRHRKDVLLDKIAELETRKEAGKVSDPKYKHEMKELRFHLAKIMDKIAQPEAEKSAKKSS